MGPAGNLSLMSTFLTAYACDSSRPYVSHLNPRPNDPVPGLAIVPLDSSRAACIYAEDATQVIVDLTEPPWLGVLSIGFHIVETQWLLVEAGLGVQCRCRVAFVEPTRGTGVTYAAQRGFAGSSRLARDGA